jgi:hypothetical protein
MSGAFLSSVVHFLAVPSGDARSAPMATRPERDLLSFSHREWMRNLGVLDRTGLTLPLYARLLTNGECSDLPRRTIEALEARRIDNTNRMQGMLEAFGLAARALQQVGVSFVCVKGFSLFPEFLWEPWQRHQIDFDLMVAPDDTLPAQAALEPLGYKLTAVSADGERKLRIPVSQALLRDAYIYQPQQGGAIELHSRFWEAGAEEYSLACPEDAFEQAEIHTLGSVSFRRLSLPHAFLYQVLHVFRHFLGSWARPLWLYEIANFIDRHRDDDALWQRVRMDVLGDSKLAKAASLVLLTTNELFGCSIPTALESICTLPENSPIRLWIRHYARRWILTDMPGNKLNLLLQREFFPDRGEWRRYLASRLIPMSGRPALCEGIDQGIAKSYRYRVANMRFQAGRVWHHMRTNIGFAAASVAWGMHLRANQDARAVTQLRRSQS